MNKFSILFISTLHSFKKNQMYPRVLCVFPDLSCKFLMSNDLMNNIPFSKVSESHEMKKFILYYISPSWIYRICDDSNLSLMIPDNFYYQQPEFRFQYLESSSPKYILRIYPFISNYNEYHSNNDNNQIKLASWDFVFEKDTKLTLIDLLKYFQSCFCISSDSFNFEFEPCNQVIDLQIPIFDQINILKSTKIRLSIHCKTEGIGMAKQRMAVLKELLLTESNFVKCLQNIKNNITPDMMPSNDAYNRTFKSIKEITPTHENFLNDLENVGVEPETPLGELFLKWIPTFKILSSYIKNYQNAIDDLKGILRTHHHFAQKFKEITNSVFEGIPIENIFIRPIQLISQYPIFLERILKSTPKTHWDYKNLKNSIDNMKQMLIILDNEQMIQNELNQVAEIQQNIGDKVNVLETGRKLLYTLNVSYKPARSFRNVKSICASNSTVLMKTLQPTQAAILNSSLFLPGVSNLHSNNISYITLFYNEANKSAFMDGYDKSSPRMTIYLFSDILLVKKKRKYSKISILDAILKEDSQNYTFFQGKSRCFIIPKNTETDEFINVFMSSKREMINKMRSFGKGVIWSKILSCSNSILENPPALEAAGLVSIDNKLFLFGGRTHNGIISNDLWIYQNEKWEYKHTINLPPSPRFMHSMCVYKDHSTKTSKIVVFGGRDNQEFFNDLYLLDPNTYSWTLLTSKNSRYPILKEGCSVTVINDKLYVFGGTDKNKNFLNEIDVYDFTINEWYRIIPTNDTIYHTPEPRAWSSIFPVCNKADSFAIYGGTSDLNVYDDLWIFDIALNQWIKVDNYTNGVNAPGKLWGHSAAYYGDSIYLVAGNSQSYIYKLSILHEKKDYIAHFEKLYSYDQPRSINFCPLAIIDGYGIALYHKTLYTIHIGDSKGDLDIVQSPQKQNTILSPLLSSPYPIYNSKNSMVTISFDSCRQFYDFQIPFNQHNFEIALSVLSKNETLFFDDIQYRKKLGKTLNLNKFNDIEQKSMHHIPLIQKAETAKLVRHTYELKRTISHSKSRSCNENFFYNPTT